MKAIQDQKDIGGVVVDQTDEQKQIKDLKKENQRMKILLGVSATVLFIASVVFLTVFAKMSGLLKETQETKTNVSEDAVESTSVDASTKATPNPRATLGPITNPVTESRIEDTGIADQKRYISKLGITFLFMQKYGSKTYSVKEMDNKIYIFEESDPNGYKGGQYIELFKKDKKISLVQAVRNRFLGGSDTASCEVLDREILTTGIPPTVSTTTRASIQIAGASLEISDSEHLSKLAKCPKPYTMDRGSAFFQMDTRFPDRFVFLFIGEDLISAKPKERNNSLFWQDTVEFFENSQN